MKESVWVKHIHPVTFGAPEGDVKTDVLIVGGGMAGVLCAHRLKQRGVDCMLVEADRIGGGITQNTTAKITLAHGLLYDKLIRRYGVGTARRYLEAQQQACARYAQFCRDIACDYEESDAFVYALHDRRKIEREVAALRLLGVDAAFSDAAALPFAVAGAIRVAKQAQFHPLKFLYAIAEGLPVYEHTKVTEWMPHRVKTSNGMITYKKAIVATHFPPINKHGGYALKLYQHRSYVLALKGGDPIHGMYVDEADTGFSFRRYKDCLLLGGGGHRTGKRGGGFRELEEFAARYYPRAEIAARWATQDCITLDGVPYIGQYAKTTPDLFVATGFNKWGMTNAMAAADILADLVVGKTNVYARVFSPLRRVWRPQLAANLFESTVGLLTPTVPRCPHLGCALKYNAAEHSWDCPCHGSRFEEDGTLIDNPATDDMRKRPPR